MPCAVLGTSIALNSILVDSSTLCARSTVRLRTVASKRAHQRSFSRCKQSEPRLHLQTTAADRRRKPAFSSLPPLSRRPSSAGMRSGPRRPAPGAPSQILAFSAAPTAKVRRPGIPSGPHALRTVTKRPAPGDYGRTWRSRQVIRGLKRRGDTAAPRAARARPLPQARRQPTNKFSNRIRAASRPFCRSPSAPRRVSCQCPCQATGGSRSTVT